MSAERKEAMLQMDLEQAGQALVDALLALGVKGYYVPIFILKGEKIYTQEIGNVNPKTASSMMMYLFDQKTKEVEKHEQRKQRARRRRNH